MLLNIEQTSLSNIIQVSEVSLHSLLDSLFVQVIFSVCVFDQEMYLTREKIPL
jgi:hypothetical protein